MVKKFLVFHGAYRRADQQIQNTRLVYPVLESRNLQTSAAQEGFQEQDKSSRTALQINFAREQVNKMW
jgi:hypothetical protein